MTTENPSPQQIDSTNNTPTPDSSFGYIRNNLAITPAIVPSPAPMPAIILPPAIGSLDQQEVVMPAEEDLPPTQVLELNELDDPAGSAGADDGKRDHSSPNTTNSTPYFS